MTLGLNKIKYNKGVRKGRKRVGRGNASGHGTYSTRGLKGQRSRSGGKGGLKRLGFRSVLRRIPKKRGFKSAYPKYEVVNLDKIDQGFANGEKVNVRALQKKDIVGKIDKKRGVKVLGKGELNKKLVFEGLVLSASVQEKIKKAGGKII
ncbi:50S ribosomal protein L15 [Patescibacteria group bacterium]|nr:50S ribosomal protein L15 [Patescibacteria group bacterium]MBU1922071.1 50S ribosomal protein L15 [Patescibacteria group bacterium]